MEENNQMMSVEGQLVGLPLAGPESFSKKQLEYLKRALGVDETVLYEADSVTNNTAGQIFSLNESVLNFERIRITVDNMEFSNRPCTQEYTVLNSSSIFIIPDLNGGTLPSVNIPYAVYNINSDGNLVCQRRGLLYGTIDRPYHTSGDNRGYCLMKVVGIHRIAGGN